VHQIVILHMKRKLQNCTLAILFIVLFSSSYAQHRAVGPYNTGLGLRGGFLYGISIKHFLDARSGLEAIIGTRWQGYSITGLYEYQRETNFAQGLDWYFGFGAHIGSYEEKYFLESSGGKPKSSNTIYAIGVDAVVGLEFRVLKVPITFGIDFKPFMDLMNSNQNYLDAALTIRYVFH
jgi:hypothetical protein